MPEALLAFAIAFAFVFALELPDKTSAVVLVLTTRFSALAVLAGVSVAFAAHTVLAVGLGHALSLLPASLVAGGVAVIFAVAAAVLLRSGFRDCGFRDRGFRDWGYASEDASFQGPRPVSFSRAAMTSCGALFIAELGDASQLATAGLTARYAEPLAVGAGAFTAMVAVAVVAVLLGRKLRARIHPQLLQRVAGLAFACFALLAAAQAVS